MEKQNRINDRKCSIATLIVLCILTVVCVGNTAIAWKLYQKTDNLEKKNCQYKKTLDNLSERIEEINPNMDDEARRFIKHCDDSHYNILFVGNSITRHNKTSVWWSDERGMASSSLEKDYVHLLKTNLQDFATDLKPSAEDGVNSYAFNYSIWETQVNDREETYNILDTYMENAEDLDCVVIQLGENVLYNSDSTFKQDYSSLIAHIKSEAQNATIITVGDFWPDSAKDKIKKEAASSEHVGYADLSAIQGKEEYMAGMGTLVEGDDGQEHKINHEGVAKHPGDKGMQYIANSVLTEIIQATG